MATLGQTRLAPVTARDGVDTRNLENSAESRGTLGGDNLPVDVITGLGVPAVQRGVLENGKCSCGDIASKYVGARAMCDDCEWEMWVLSGEGRCCEFCMSDKDMVDGVCVYCREDDVDTCGVCRVELHPDEHRCEGLCVSCFDKEQEYRHKESMVQLWECVFRGKGRK